GIGSMVVVEMNEAASGASGRNEGVVVMGRFFSYVKEMMLDDLLETRPDLTNDERVELAQKFAEKYVRAAYKNADMIEKTIRKEKYEVEYIRAGWVENFDDRQDYIDESIKESEDFGFDDWTKLSPREVQEISGIEAKKYNGFSKSAATWNPAKWVWALLSTAILSDKVSFFSNTRVDEIADNGNNYAVHTTRGTIQTKYLINATESYAANLHPQFIDKLWPLQTQAAFAEGGPSTIKQGVAMGGANSWFGKHQGGIFMGSDGTRVHHTRAGYINPSRFITKYIISDIQDSFVHSPMHVTREWSCTAGFTKDEYPIIGLIDGKRQYIIAGMCGSGSSVHFNGARHVIQKILGIQSQDDYPEEFFSPTRILEPKSHKWPSLDG
ncbi:MAG: FAD-dependent oxidoreductase, partial [SAR202 cluster bacterium]|nr:FAD-dependent oxidoreductase [SAR202 cluster bacterium]